MTMDQQDNAEPSTATRNQIYQQTMPHPPLPQASALDRQSQSHSRTQRHHDVEALDPIQLIPGAPVIPFGSPYSQTSASNVPNERTQSHQSGRSSSDGRIGASHSQPLGVIGGSDIIYPSSFGHQFPVDQYGLSNPHRGRPSIQDEDFQSSLPRQSERNTGLPLDHPRRQRESHSRPRAREETYTEQIQAQTGNTRNRTQSKGLHPLVDIAAEAENLVRGNARHRERCLQQLTPAQLEEAREYWNGMGWDWDGRLLRE